MPKDEAYVIDICDRLLGLAAERQHRFDFLRGDPGKHGRCTKLPVDAYYPGLDLVIEYWERQHLVPMPIMDRRPTCSGCTRGEQRRIYDERKKDLLERNGVALVVVSYDELACDARGRLLGRSEVDEVRLRDRIHEFISQTPANGPQ